MKLQEAPPVVVRSGEFTETTFGISLDNQAHIITILRDKLYTNKPLAVIREYSTNAVDAHVEAGKADQPIVVSLPGEFDPVFRVRDYGSGLSEDEVSCIYVQYGVSTKRHSDDYVGQLGIGCKSAFAYTDTFMIVSYKDGKKTTYSAYIDETKLGKIAKMGEEPTDEPSGIEIVVPVNSKDFDTFRDQAKRVFRFFPVKPVIMGAADFDYDEGVPEVLSGFDHEDGLKWRVMDQGSPMAIMGNIGYPLQAGSMGQLENWERSLLQCALHVNFNIGDLEIAANREGLEYKPRTIEKIRNKLALVKQAMMERVQQHIEEASNIVEARQAYVRYFSNAKRTGFSNFITATVGSTQMYWRGVAISGTILATHSAYGGPIYTTQIIECCDRTTYRHRRRYGSSSSTGGNTSFKYQSIFEINAGENIALVEVDTKDKWFSRVTQLYLDLYAQTGKKHVIYAIKWGSDAEKQKLMDKYSLQHAPIIKVSGLAWLAKSTTQRLSGGDNSKHKTKVFQLRRQDLTRSLSVRSGYWDQADVDLKNGTGYYVELDNFMMNMWGSKTHRVSMISIMLDLLSRYSIANEHIVIHGFKTKLMPKVGSGWARFETWVENQLATVLEAKNRLITRHVDYRLCDDLNCYDSSSHEELEKLLVHVRDHKSPFISFLQHVVEMGGSEARGRENEHSSVYNFLRRTGIFQRTPPSYDLAEQRMKIYTRYPMLATIGMFDRGYDSFEFNHFTSEELPAALRGIIDYVNDMDELYEARRNAVNEEQLHSQTA